MTDHGVAVEHVEGMSKKVVEDNFRQIFEKNKSDSSISKRKPSLISLAEKERKGKLGRMRR